MKRGLLELHVFLLQRPALFSKPAQQLAKLALFRLRLTEPFLIGFVQLLYLTAVLLNFPNLRFQRVAFLLKRANPRAVCRFSVLTLFLLSVVLRLACGLLARRSNLLAEFPRAHPLHVAHGKKFFFHRFRQRQQLLELAHASQCGQNFRLLRIPLICRDAVLRHSLFQPVFREESAIVAVTPKFAPLLDFEQNFTKAHDIRHGARHRKLNVLRDCRRAFPQLVDGKCRQPDWAHLFHLFFHACFLPYVLLHCRSFSMLCPSLKIWAGGQHVPACLGR